ncbi:MAG: MurR/RpiR family transcriptional regulator [Mycoplasmatales bacterium]
MEFETKLTKAEKQCLQKINTLGPKLIKMTIYDLCTETMYSTATINRLIKKIGFHSFKEYKYFIGEHLFDTNNYDYKQILINLYSEDMNYALNVAVAKIKQADTIHIIAKGISKGAGNELAFSLDLLGFNIMLHESCEMLVSNAFRIIKPTDLLIFVSYAGMDKDMILISRAVYKHVYTILYTVTKNNDLARECDFVIKSPIDNFDDQIKIGIPLSIMIHRTIIKLKKSY